LCGFQDPCVEPDNLIRYRSVTQEGTRIQSNGVTAIWGGGATVSKDDCSIDEAWTLELLNSPKGNCLYGPGFAFRANEDPGSGFFNGGIQWVTDDSCDDGPALDSAIDCEFLPAACPVCIDGKPTFPTDEINTPPDFDGTIVETYSDPDTILDALLRAEVEPDEEPTCCAYADEPSPASGGRVNTGNSTAVELELIVADCLPETNYVITLTFSNRDLSDPEDPINLPNTEIQLGITTDALGAYTDTIAIPDPLPLHERCWIASLIQEEEE
jgi:hypothetical protein